MYVGDLAVPALSVAGLVWLAVAGTLFPVVAAQVTSAPVEDLQM